MNLSERVCPDCLVVVSFKWLSRNVQQAFILLIVLLFAAKARNTKNPEVKFKGQQTVNKARKKKKKKKKKNGLGVPISAFSLLLLDFTNSINLLSLISGALTSLI